MRDEQAPRLPEQEHAGRDDPRDELTPEERLQEAASILARGIRRLIARDKQRQAGAASSAKPAADLASGKDDLMP